MNQLSRQKDLIEYITKVKKADLRDIAQHFGVSHMTIRRDILNLEEHGMITLNRGIVTMNLGTALELSPNLKTGQMIKEKKRMAKAAIPFIGEGLTVFLDAGTTIRELALELIPLKNISVVTNSLLVINTLCNFSHINLVSVPGTFHERSMSFCDSCTADFLRSVRVDISFLGAESVSAENGVMVPNIDDCMCKKIMTKAGKRVIVLADSSKIGSQSAYAYAPIADVDVLITDKLCRDESVAAIEHTGTKVLCV